MPRYGDPDVLDAHARRLAADAAAVSGRAAALGAVAATMQWQGPAATAFRRTVDGDVEHLHRAARELDQAAAELRAHATEVRERLARIAALEDAVSGWFADRLSALQEAVTDPVGTLRRAVSDPPWSSWAWRPGNLPGPGDLAWLDVGDYLLARGVAL